MKFERLADTEAIRKIEGKLTNLISRTFLTGALNVPASQISISVKRAFSTKTYQVQIDKIIDEIYFASVEYADNKALELEGSGSAQASKVAAKNDPLPVTVEAIKQTKVLSGEAAASVEKWLQEENLYQMHPWKLADQVRDLWDGEKWKARRFAVTFTADVAENTAIKRYAAMGIKYLQFFAEIDDKTTAQCRQFHGTIIKSDSLDAERYRPPLHHNCRSCLIPATSKTVKDQDLLIENRNFSQHYSQDFTPLKMRTDSETVSEVFQNIDKFNDKYRISQFILDEDTQLRLMKLKLSIGPELPGKTTLTDFIKPDKVEPPKPKVQTIEEIVQGYETNIKGLPKEHAYLVDPADGRIVISKAGTKNAVQFNERELDKFKGRILTHNHPRGTSFSKDDINLACTYELKEIRAVGKNLTYVLRMNNGENLYLGLGNRLIRNYKTVESQVIADLMPKVLKGEMTPADADLILNHEVWTRLAKNIKQLDYTYIEGS